MKMELYKLEKPAGFNLKSRIEGIIGERLTKRNRPRTAGLIRLEHLEKRGNLWLCDFVKIRTDHGPSKAGENCPAQGFELEKSEGFGEETAMLWNTATDWCILQYNHYGCRAKLIAEYLAHYVHAEPVDLHLRPKIDDDIHAKILHKKLVNKLSFSIAPKEVSNADFRYGASVGRAAQMLLEADADRVEITITARRKGRLNLALPDFMGWVERLGHGAEDSPIGSAHATARADDDDKPEVLDLLHGCVTTEESILPGVDKRYSMKDRFDAVHRAHDGWTALMKP